MPYYGGTAGFIHCGYKILYRQDGWFDQKGLHVKDDRLAGGTRRVDGDIRASERLCKSDWGSAGDVNVGS